MSQHHIKLGGQTRRNMRKIRDKLFLAQDKLCLYCKVGTTLPTSVGYFPTWATLEHIEKISLGGSNTEENFVMICMKCNSHKKKG